MSTRRGTVDEDTVEKLRRGEVSRLLRKTGLSSEEAEAVERFSRTLVARLRLGPISAVMAHAGDPGFVEDEPPERDGTTKRVGKGGCRGERI